MSLHLPSSPGSRDSLFLLLSNSIVLSSIPSITGFRFTLHWISLLKWLSSPFCSWNSSQHLGHCGGARWQRYKCSLSIGLAQYWNETTGNTTTLKGYDILYPEDSTEAWSGAGTVLAAWPWITFVVRTCELTMISAGSSLIGINSRSLIVFILFIPIMIICGIIIAA